VLPVPLQRMATAVVDLTAQWRVDARSRDQELQAEHSRYTEMMDTLRHVWHRVVGEHPSMPADARSVIDQLVAVFDQRDSSEKRLRDRIHELEDDLDVRITRRVFRLHARAYPQPFF